MSHRSPKSFQVMCDNRQQQTCLNGAKMQDKFVRNIGVKYIFCNSKKKTVLYFVHKSTSTMRTLFCHSAYERNATKKNLQRENKLLCKERWALTMKKCHLCEIDRSFLAGDIPLHKLENTIFKEFLERYMNYDMPVKKLQRTKYAKRCKIEGWKFSKI